MDECEPAINRRQLLAAVTTGAVTAVSGCSSNTEQPTETQIELPTGVSEKWSFETGDVVRSSPTVVGDTVYIGSHDKSVYALSIEDGSEKWSVETNHKIDSSPTVVDGTVYIGNTSGIIYALAAEDGTERWRSQTNYEIRTTPAVSEQAVYVASNDNRIGSSSKGRLYAVSTEDGSHQWSVSTRSVVTSPIVTTSAAGKDTIYFGTESGILYAVSGADGSEKWSFSFSIDHIEAPTIVNDTVYLGSATDMYALSADDGTKQWGRRDADDHSSIITQPTVVDGDIYIGRDSNGRDSNGLYVISNTVGKQKWNFETISIVQTTPAVANDVVYFASNSGTVRAVSAEDGTELWSFDTRNDSSAPVSVMDSDPVVVDDTVYIGSDSHKVYALSNEYPNADE